ncbi:PQQ-dependent sugar dehydrogenase [Halobacteria archaeon AArc-dxtr1]|nr:PQQ-dependent sugar dehydrogenase [Halobacteria archaeon AArc-dxtr1]
MSREERVDDDAQDGQRRHFLRVAAATGIVGIAGCADVLDEELGEEGDDSEGDDEESDDGEEPGDEGENGAAVFDLRSLELSSEAVAYGETSTVTATVENTGGSEGTQDVEFRVDGDVRAGESLTLEPDTEEAVEFDLETAGLAVGDHEITVHTADDTESASATIEYAQLPETVALEPVATGIDMVVGLEFVPGSDLRYVASLYGEISVWDGDEQLDEPLLDLGDEITVAGADIGLLGIELHPEFADNGRLFVRYSAPSREGTPDDYSHTAVLSEFTVEDDHTGASLTSERTIMETPNPEDIHSSGDLRFGPDGYLYVPMGDGGFGTAHFGQETGVDGTPHGGILRLDVDSDPTHHPRTDPDGPDDPDGEDGYALPDDNPLSDDPDHRDEYYAWGLRNPWRTSFDGDRYFVGDVGEVTWEAVYLVESGMNLGWNVTEGSHCLHGDDCPSETDARGGESFVDPIIEYPNEPPTEGDVNGVCVIGGHVYGGEAVPGFGGRYVFGDLQHGERVFASVPSDPTDLQAEWETEIVSFAAADAGTFGQLLSFAEDSDGELYALTDNGVYRLAPTGEE